MPIKRVRNSKKLKHLKDITRYRLTSRKSGVQISPTAVENALQYIDAYWETLLRSNPEDKGSLIGLPNPYLIPSKGFNDFSFEEQYYWDSYFTALGLQGKDDETLVTGMLDNLLHLLNRFSVVPNASRMYFVGRSQPPLLTTYIFHVYDTYQKSDEWLRDTIEKAKLEYHSVWMSDKHPHWRKAYRDLSRYYDVNVLHDLAEAESGWDMTTRFRRKCLDYLPVDLNALLYKYETDFARAAELLGDDSATQHWQAAAAQRKAAMSQCMWSDKKGMFFDYNFVSKQMGTVSSLATYYPMWAGLASDEQAAQLVEQLKKFEHSGGLATTARPVIDLNMFGSVKAQWAHPNGWAPLHCIVIEGLERYGYTQDAERIARKWIKTNTDWFSAHGEFLEKYNVVHPEKPPLEGVYPSQKGFGWTNGVYSHLVRKYSS